MQFVMAKAMSPAGITALTGAAAAAGVALFNLAQDGSALIETQNKVNEIFSTGAADITNWSEKSATALGQSQKEALDGAATFGILAKSAGLTDDKMVAFSITMTQLATDLASFNNTSTTDAITALGAGLRGENEPLRRFGVLLDEATLRQSALRQGIIDTNRQLTPSEKVMAAYYEILRQTSVQQGDFARTADSLANKQKVANSELDNAKRRFGKSLQGPMKAVIDLGTDFLNLLNGAGQAYSGFTGGLQDMADATVQLASQFPGLGFLWNEQEDDLTANEDAAIAATDAFNRLKNEMIGVWDAINYGQKPLNWLTQIGLPNLNDHLQSLGFDTTISDANGFGRALQNVETPLQKFLKSLADAKKQITDTFMGLFDLGSIYKDSKNFPDFMSRVKGVVKQIKNYGANLLKLRDMGLGPLAIQGIMNMDLMSGATLAEDLLAQSNVMRDIGQLNTAYNAVSTVAGQVGGGLALGQAGGTVNQYITITNPNPKAVVQALREYGRNAGPLPLAVTGSY